MTPSNCLANAMLLHWDMQVYFLQRSKYGTVIDDVLFSLWFSAYPVR